MNEKQNNSDFPWQVIDLQNCSTFKLPTAFKDYCQSVAFLLLKEQANLCEKMITLIKKKNYSTDNATI